jgi:hypothetical protein
MPTISLLQLIFALRSYIVIHWGRANIVRNQSVGAVS